MSVAQIPNLGAAIALNGTEQFEAVQAGTSVRVTTAQLGAYIQSAASLTVGLSTITGGAAGSVLYDNSGALGEYALTGTPGFVVMSNSPTLVTPNLGTPSVVTLTNATGLPLTTGVTGVLPIASGGTNGTAAPTAGGVAYGTGSAYALTLAGTVGQYLQSNGAGAPTWSTVSSSVGQTGYYGSFFDNGADQTAASTAVAYPVRLNSTAESNGISIGGAGNTRITFANAGTYTILPSIQFVNSDAQTYDVDLWFRLNGADIADSNSQFSIPGKHSGVNGNLIATLALTVTVAAGQYIELVWRTSDTSVYIHTYAADVTPTRPEVPGVIVAVTSQPQIGLGYANLTSTTSRLIGVGSKTFTVNLPDTSSAYEVGSRVRVAYSVTPSNFMEGVITAYSGTSLTVSVDTIGGSGTYASWNFSIAGSAGLTVGTTTVSSGTSGRILYDNSGVLGEYTVTGTAGSVVLSQNAVANYTSNQSLTTAQSYGVFTNSGASGTVVLTLPAATVGLQYTMAVTAAQTLQINVTGGSVVIGLGELASTAGGNISSNSPYSAVTLVCLSSTLWVATSVVGTWSPA